MKTLMSFSIAFLISIQAWGQETSKITPRLQAHLQEVSDTTRVPILIVFKNTRTWTKAELRDLDNMSRNDRQNYVVAEVKAVADIEFAPVLAKLQAAERTQQVARIRPLSAAGAIGCDATKNAIAMIDQIPNIAYIKWDKPVPLEEIIDSPPSGAASTAPSQPLMQSTPEIQWTLDQINVPEVWDLGMTGEGVLVAILDTGTDYDHNDLEDHLWDGSNFEYQCSNCETPVSLVNHGWDTVDDDNDPKNEGSSHGTNVAGLFVGDGTNGKATGVAKDATLMILRSVAGSSGETGMMDGFEWFFEMKSQNPSFVMPQVINHSAGRTFDLKPAYSAWRTLMNNFLAAGIVVVNSAGNEGELENDTLGCTGQNSTDPFGSGIPYNVNVPNNIPPPWLHPDQPAPESTDSSHVSAVITVGSTDDNDDIMDHSSRGPATWEDIQDDFPCQDPIPSGFWDYLYLTGSQNPLLKPDVTAPGNWCQPTCEAQKFFTTDPNNSYEDEFGGTSSSAPLVAGTIALMFDANPDLTPAEVSRIIQLTAVDLGASGKDNDYGAGRVDAYQAVLMALAYDNKSVDSDATAHNGGRRLVRDGSGDYHLIFGSGGEIFYRKYDGSAWLEPHRLSDGADNNNFPSITERSGTVYVTWQKNTGSNHNIYFHKSTDGGGTWNDSNRLVIATNVGSAEPLPVILSPSSSNLVIAYRSGNSLTSQHSSNDGASWQSDSITHSGEFLSSPSITRVAQLAWGSADTPALVFDSSDGEVYYRYYDGTWTGEENLSSIVPGSSETHQTPSITLEGSWSRFLHVAWHATSGPGPFQNTIIYRQSDGYNSWPNEYTRIYYEQQRRPTITAQSSNSIDVIFQVVGYSNDDVIYKQHFDGSYWSGPILVDDGEHPSVSSGASSAKYVWTSDTGPPYEVKLSSETLNKQGTGGQETYTRAINWLHPSGAYLQVHVKELSLKLNDGQKQTLSFLPVSLDTVNFTPANAWTYLASALTPLPTRAESLVVNYTVTAENVQQVGSPPGNNPNVKIELLGSAGQSLAAVQGPSFAKSGSIPTTAYRLASDLSSSGIPASTSIQPVVKVAGFNARTGVFASLGHIYDFSDSTAGQSQLQAASAEFDVPETTALLANYPNPFNPETTIQYQIEQRGRVTLNIYNLLGEEIRTLIDEVQAPGVHSVRWDGRDRYGVEVASGVYVSRLQIGEKVEARKMLLVR